MKSTNEANLIKNAGASLDFPTFEQILQMDDEEDEVSFSRDIVYEFFTQASSTFKDMDREIDERNLAEISALGHFLKGSSATLGLTKVKDSCEKIQHLGQRKDETGSHDLTISDDEILEKLKVIITQTKSDFKDIEKVLKNFYES